MVAGDRSIGPSGRRGRAPRNAHSTGAHHPVGRRTFVDRVLPMAAGTRPAAPRVVLRVGLKARPRRSGRCRLEDVVVLAAERRLGSLPAQDAVLLGRQRPRHPARPTFDMTRRLAAGVWVLTRPWSPYADHHQVGPAPGRRSWVWPERRPRRPNWPRRVDMPAPEPARRVVKATGRLTRRRGCEHPCDPGRRCRS